MMQDLRIRAMHKKFLAWKRKLDEPPPLDRHRNGRYIHKGVQREWCAYYVATDNALPEKAPKHVIDLMVSKGVRPAWVNEIYDAMRIALLTGENHEQ